MTSIKDTLNPGDVANPGDWIEKQLVQAAKWGFPFTALVNVDSDFAAELMERNTRNRPLRERRAMRYRHDMENGLWRINGEPIIVTKDGAMISGQHRCTAIIGTELSVPMFVAIGVDPDADVTVDQGAPKNAGDYLQIHGEENAPTLAKIARLRLAYEANEQAAIKDTATPTNADVMTYVAEHHDDVTRSAKLATELREYTKPIAAPSVIGFAHNVLSSIDPEAADRYIEEVAKGEEIKEGDPAFAVRTRLLNMGKAGIAKKAEIIFTGWNAYRAGRQMKSVRVTGRLPRLAA